MYEIIKFMSLPEIITKMMAVSREMNNFIKSENYLLFKKFLQ